MHILLKPSARDISLCTIQRFRAMTRFSRLSLCTALLISGFVGTASAAPRSGQPESPLVCLDVHIDPALKGRHNPRRDVNATGALIGKLVDRLRQEGVDPHSTARLSKVETGHGLQGINPRCAEDPEYWVSLTFEPLADGGQFHSSMRITRRGVVVSNTDRSLDIRDFPSNTLTDKLSYYMYQEFDRYVGIIYTSVEWG